MVDKIVSVITTAFIVTAIGIAVNPKAKTAQVITALTGGIAKMQRAAQPA